MALLSVVAPQKPPFRSRASFQARTAEDTTSQLDRRTSLHNSSDDLQSARSTPPLGREISQRSPGYLDGSRASGGTLGWDSLKKVFSVGHGRIRLEDNEPSRRKRPSSKSPGRAAKYKPPRSTKGTLKLGTYAGVFVPVSLNVLSILMFLRFGFILGQSGVLGMIGKPWLPSPMLDLEFLHIQRALTSYW